MRTSIKYHENSIGLAAWLSDNVDYRSMDWVFIYVHVLAHVLSLAVFVGGSLTLLPTDHGWRSNCVRVAICGPKQLPPLLGIGLYVPTCSRGLAETDGVFISHLFY